jgi:acyl carrier protein
MASSVEETVITVFQQVFKNKGLAPPRLDAQTPLDGSLGLESIDFAEIVLRLEEAFGADPFANGVPSNLRTLGDLAALYSR